MNSSKPKVMKLPVMSFVMMIAKIVLQVSKVFKPDYTSIYYY